MREGVGVAPIHLGLRRGEVLGFTWDDVDLDESELIIGHQLQRVSRRLLPRDTKTEASDAPLPIPNICLLALKLRKERQREAKQLAGGGWQDSDFVFTTAT